MIQSNQRQEDVSVPQDAEEENILKQQLETLRNEKCVLISSIVMMINIFPINRAHLTNILPSFRLTAADEEEDLTSGEMMEEDSAVSTVGGSLEPETASPTLNKPFKLSEVASEYSSTTPVSFTRTGLTHLTKRRAHLPSNRRLPSKYKTAKSPSSSTERRESSSSNGNLIGASAASARRSCSITSCSSLLSNTGLSSRKESQATLEDTLFHSDDKPVAV